MRNPLDGLRALELESSLRCRFRNNPYGLCLPAIEVTGCTSEAHPGPTDRQVGVDERGEPDTAATSRSLRTAQGAKSQCRCHREVTCSPVDWEGLRS